MHLRRQLSQQRCQTWRAGWDKNSLWRYFCWSTLSTLSKIKMKEKNPIPIRLPSLMLKKDSAILLTKIELGLNTCVDTLNSNSLQNSCMLSTCVFASNCPACMCAGGVSYHNKAVPWAGWDENSSWRFWIVFDKTRYNEMLRLFWADKFSPYLYSPNAS